MSLISRRGALAALIAGFPAAALAARHRIASAAGVSVDVSPLRRSGDNTDADYLAETLPGYLSQYVGPGHRVRARIDSVTYGAPGSAGDSHNNRAVDWIEGVGWIDGREIPLNSSIVTEVYFPDVGGYAARQRQDMLARSFAQWLPRQAGL